MELTTTYILSQVFTIIMYILLAVTYFLKNRKTILIVSFLSIISLIIAYILLSAWSGLAMCFLAIFRNVIFIIDEKKNGHSDKITKKDMIILGILVLIALISAVYTYEGFGSLLSIFATMLYTFSVWQKSTRVYKFCGMPVGVLWILYNIYIKSIFGIILESILLIVTIAGYVSDIRGQKKNKKEI